MRYHSIIAIILAAMPYIANAGDSSGVIHDCHIHYEEDVWVALPPADAIKMLKAENISRSLVSATPTEGAEM